MPKLAELNLLSGLPKTQRNICARAHEKSEHHVEISRQYGEEYFGGPREYGYGGYKYDGRWLPVARDIVAHFGLKRGDCVIDIGCAKGYLVEDLMSVFPGLEAFGLTFFHTHFSILAQDRKAAWCSATQANCHFRTANLLVRFLLTSFTTWNDLKRCRRLKNFSV